MNNFEEKLKAELKQTLATLKDSSASLQMSLEKCQKIGIKDNYSFEESESMDSLTSKYARTSDIFTQKALRAALLLLREKADSFIDKANLAEKFGMVTSAEELISIRDLRNLIAHQYLKEQLLAILREVFSKAQVLLKEIEAFESFCVRKLGLEA